MVWQNAYRCAKTTRNVSICKEKMENIMSEIKPLIAGNWKMNGSKAMALELVKELHTKYQNQQEKNFDLLICPPFTLIDTVAEQLKNSGIKVGAQNLNALDNGPHTGEISTELLKDVGASYVIIGHSERRIDQRENNQECKEKAKKAIADNLTVILCIGETKEEKDTGLTLDILTKELIESFPENASSKNMVIAYEPIWAIGTGVTPTLQDIKKVHDAIRSTLADLIGIDDAPKMRILYGGSVKPTNAKEILNISNVNGALVGGASLNAEDFWTIALAANCNKR